MEKRTYLGINNWEFHRTEERCWTTDLRSPKNTKQDKYSKLDGTERNHRRPVLGRIS